MEFDFEDQELVIREKFWLQEIEIIRSTAKMFETADDDLIPSDDMVNPYQIDIDEYQSIDREY